MSLTTLLSCARRGVIATVLAVVAVGLSQSGAAHAAPDDAITSAAYGKAEIWLQHKADDRHRRELVFKASPDAPARVLSVTVPPRDTSSSSEWGENLALGRDQTGKLTVVMQSRRGLYWTHVTSEPRLHRVPRTTKDDVFPSLFRGRVASSHAAGMRSSVRLGSLTGGLTRQLWTNGSDDNLGARDTAIGAGNAVAFVTVADGAEEGLFDARLVRPSQRRRFARRESQRAAPHRRGELAGDSLRAAQWPQARALNAQGGAADTRVRSTLAVDRAVADTHAPDQGAVKWLTATSTACRRSTRPSVPAT
jgi:hypothetical protein